MNPGPRPIAPWWADRLETAMKTWGLAAVILLSILGFVGAFAWRYGGEWVTAKAAVEQSNANTNLSNAKTLATVANAIVELKELVKLATANSERILMLLDKVAVNEESQLRWQTEWRTYIEAQHKMRAEESKTLLAHQQKASDFFERTDKIHAEQIEILKTIGDDLKTLHAERDKAKRGQ